MNWDKKITLARAVRTWEGNIAEITLVWRCYFSKLGIEYRQVSNEHDDLLNDIPDHCVIRWLWIFVRPQEHLSEDSYYITLPPSPLWLNIINAVRA